jgi:class 3 adenylate cyclase
MIAPPAPARSTRSRAPRAYASRRPGPQPTGPRTTILFSDIEGSTTLIERVGDHRWVDVLRAHNAIVRSAVRRHGGREVKFHGDGFMLVFGDPAGALACAVAIQRGVARWTARHPDVPLRIRIGAHAGAVVTEDGDLFGLHVCLASRIAALARGGEILVSSVVRDLVEHVTGLPFGDEREVALRGLAGRHRLFPVGWAAAAA